MIGDLHVHTTRSDGSYSPRRPSSWPRNAGLDYIGIVDHDTTEGLEEAVELGLRLGVAVVPGVEISAYDYKRRRKAHLLGYRLRLAGERISKALCAPLLEDARREHARSTSRPWPPPAIR